MTDSNPKKTILIVMAHPDDESFGMGGTIAYYDTLGVDVHLACATRGEAGTVDPEYMTKYKTIAELREAELMCAADALGLKSVNFLNYRDSGMVGSDDNKNPLALVQAPLEQVAGRIVAEIRRLKPQVVITFDETGGYYHPDHIHIHKATVAAFHAAGDASQYPEAGAPYQPAQLYVNARNRARLRRAVFLMRLVGKDPSKVGRNKDIDLTRLARDKDTAPHVTINYRSVQGRKDKADACHASQGGGRFIGSNLLEVIARWLGNKDRFTRIVPATPDDYRTNDLFAE
ncbi:MAG TPA: PIG-L family deacetylase [Anaerolineales bacterium]|nr:PIG-L family deacetylase [Anaerolineales bacterium]HRQ93208.1 PIG-L family deacetylase [Anaerolineales bacterium]